MARNPPPGEAVRNLEHKFQHFEGRLDSLENSLQTIQTTMAAILQSLSGLGLDHLQTRSPQVNVRHQKKHAKIEFNKDQHDL